MPVSLLFIMLCRFGYAFLTLGHIEYFHCGFADVIGNGEFFILIYAAIGHVELQFAEREQGFHHFAFVIAQLDFPGSFVVDDIFGISAKQRR